MPRTKQLQVQQPKWTEIFAGDSDDDDSDVVAAAKPPLPKKPRLLENVDNAANLSMDSSTRSTEVTSAIKTSILRSFLPSSSDSENEMPQVLLPPRSARKRPPPLSTTPTQQRSSTPKRWRLQPIIAPNSRTSATKLSSTPTEVALQPVGWKTRSEMHKIAERHQGTFLQYKILRRPPGRDQIRDQNFAASKPTKDDDDDHDDDDIPPVVILPQDLIVQSRFVSKSGNLGGNSYSFLDWKLPGKFLKQRRQHMTIFKDTRPKLYNPTPRTMQPAQQEDQSYQHQQTQGDVHAQRQVERDMADNVMQQQQVPLRPLPTQTTPPSSQEMPTLMADETAHPMLFLAPDLTHDEVDMVTKFLQEAQAGTTPREFFRHDQEQIRLATPVRELNRDDHMGSKQSMDMEENGERPSRRQENGTTTTRHAESNAMETDDTMMLMASDDEENGNLPPDTTTVENGRFLQYVFHDLSPTRELDQTNLSSAVAAQPALTEQALVAHERRWSSSSTPPVDPIRRMIDWSNASNVNSDSAPPSGIEHRLQAYSLIEQPSTHHQLPLSALRSRLESIPSPPNEMRGASSTQRAVLPDQPTWNDFTILQNNGSKNNSHRKPPPSSDFIVKRDRIILPSAKKYPPKAPQLQRNLERDFADDGGATARRGLNILRNRKSVKQISHAHDDDEDELVPFADDWIEDSHPIIAAKTNPLIFQDFHQNTTSPASGAGSAKKTCLHPNKTGRNALGNKFWLSLLILCWLPLAWKDDSMHDSMKVWAHNLSVLGSVFYDSISSIQSENLRNKSWADIISSVRFDELVSAETWSTTVSAQRFESLVDREAWEGLFLRLQAMLGETNENLIELPTPPNACAAIVEGRTNITSFSAEKDSPVSTMSSTSAPSSAQLQTSLVSLGSQYWWMYLSGACIFLLSIYQ